MKNASVPVKDRVKEFSYKVSGGNFGSAVRRQREGAELGLLPLVQPGIYTP